MYTWKSKVYLVYQEFKKRSKIVISLRHLIGVDKVKENNRLFNLYP